jgi:hypothetical protein
VRWLSKLTGRARRRDRFVASAPTAFDVLPAWALERAADDEYDFPYAQDPREKLLLRRAIIDALAGGWSVDQAGRAIVQRLADVGITPSLVSPGGNQLEDVKTWARTVAHWEIMRTSLLGGLDLYRKAGVKLLRWSARASDASCDPCILADGAVVPIGTPFPHVNVPLPPVHDGCGCGIIAADPDLGDWSGTQEQRDRASRGGYSAEEWEAKFGHKHRIDVLREMGLR